ncbi:MAG: transcription antitermination factor NusB [Clostridiales bacterium]|jgi:N utilization substance protein B|nr:transcription antitermination factor NusB [Clostridiales bacterium]
MNTQKARDYAYKLIYELEIKKQPADEVLEMFFEKTPIPPKAREYISGLVTCVYERQDELNVEIEKHLRGWRLERVSKLSMAGIKLAICEMDLNKKITPAIAISEAINMVAVYESEEEASFVNGVLGEYMRANNKESGLKEQDKEVDDKTEASPEGGSNPNEAVQCEAEEQNLEKEKTIDDGLN